MKRFLFVPFLLAACGPSGPYTEFIYEVQGDNAEETQKTAEIFNRRFSRAGLSRATVRVVSDRIEVRVFESDRGLVEAYKRLIEDPAKLELRQLGNQTEHRIAKEASWKETSGLLLRKNPEPRDTPPSVVAYEYVLLCDPPVLTGEHIANASTNRSVRGLTWQINFKLTTEGSKRFLEATTQLSQSRPKGHIAILLNDKILSIPVVETPIKDECVIHGEFTEDEANRLAAVLGAGGLPKPLRFVSERDHPGK